MTKETFISRSPESRTFGRKGKQDVIYRIERTRRDLLQIREQLCSYRCEPKTLETHKMLEDLKLKLEELGTNNLEIMGNIRSCSSGALAQFGNIKSHFEALKELQTGVASYRQELRGI